MKSSAGERMFSAAGMVAGLTIGSGIFALPYAVATSGIGWSIGLALVAFAAVLGLHLAYGEVISSTRERHRLPGYVGRYLGRVAGRVEGANQILLLNGILLGYGLLGGLFLSKLMGGAAGTWSVVFFAAGALLLLGRAQRIGEINFILTAPLVTALLALGVIGILKGGVPSVAIVPKDPLFVFGVFLYALSGYTVIADAYQMMNNGNGDRRRLLLLIIFGLLIPLLTAAVFVTGILRASPFGVTPDALSGLSPLLGNAVVSFGAGLGFVAVFKSFLALGYDLKEIYELDFAIPAWLSWLLVALGPVTPFLFGAHNFVELIALVGGLFIAIDGIFIVLMLRRVRLSGASRMHFLPGGAAVRGLLLLVFVASAVYEIFHQLR